MQQLYEIEDLSEYRPEHVHHALISTLTGLSFEEIAPHAKAGGMTGNEWRKLFQKLGFNTSKRFIKFDAQTKYPVLLRCHHLHDDKHWHAFVYYNDRVYAPHHGGAYPTLDNFLEFNKYLKITSMLQVWI